MAASRYNHMHQNGARGVEALRRSATCIKASTAIMEGIDRQTMMVTTKNSGSCESIAIDEGWITTDPGSSTTRQNIAVALLEAT